MGYRIQNFTGFFPEPPTAQDLKNFDRAMVPQVMLFWDTATPDLLAAFAERVRTYVEHMTAHQENVRIILRMNDECIGRNAGLLMAQYAQKQQAAQGRITTVIVAPNEPDLPLGPEGLRWHKSNGQIPTWGNVSVLDKPTLIQQTADTVRRLSNVMQSASRTLQIVSPAFSMRGYTEDDAPDPGLHTWRELLAPVWYGAQSGVIGNAVHYYDGGWWVHDPTDKITSHEAPPGYYSMRDMQAYAQMVAAARLATQTNVQRFEHWVRVWSAFHHHMLYIDECNTNNSTMSSLEHMEACIGKSKLLLHHVNPQGYVLGERVAMFCPFSFNGLANTYPAQYVMTDPADYELLRAHMEEEGYVDGE